MKTRIAIIPALLAALLLCALTACGKTGAKQADTETLKTFMDANVKEELWKRHQVFRIDFTEYREGEVFETLSYYLDSDHALWDFSRGEKWLFTRDVSLDLYTEGGTRQYYAYLSDSDELIEGWMDGARDNEFLELTEIDRVVETADNGEGTFTGVIEYNDPEKVEQVIKNNAPDLPEGLEYAEGMAIRYQYDFSTKTKDLLGYQTFLVRAGEEPELVNAAAYTYDGKRRDPFAADDLFGDYRAALEDPAQRRTVTLVFAPDTEEENARQYVLPLHAGFYVYSQGAPVDKCYTDRACTQPRETDDVTEDMTLYIPATPA